MSERLYAIGDIGATNTRIGICDNSGLTIISRTSPTNMEDYDATIDSIAENVKILSERSGGVVAASIAVAAEVSEEGVLLRAGGLNSWVGNNLTEDLEAALALSKGLVGTPNDVVAIAISQQEINARNGRPVQGIATTLSSGWGGALYWEDGRTKADEPGHQYLRAGGICPCGEEGHAEAFISGNGVMRNHGLSMPEWLLHSDRASDELVTDLSVATIGMIERQEDANSGFEVEEVRWTGGVALGNPFIIQRVASEVQFFYKSDQHCPVAFDTVTMAEQAGLHGTFIDAQRRAQQY